MKALDTFVMALELNTDKMDSGLQKAQESLSAFGSFVTGIGISFGQTFGNMLQEAIRTIPRMFNEMKEDVKALDELNKKTNASVEDIAAWGNAVELSGGSAKSFQGTLLHLYNDLSRIAITGKGRSKPFLEALGIDVASLKDKEIFDVIEEIQKSVQGMDTKKSSYALKNLGFDPDTIKFLQADTKETKELIKQQKEWGIYTAKDTEALDKMDKAIKRVRNVLKGSIIPIFSKVLELFSKGANYIAKWITYLRKNTDVLRGAVLLLAAAFSGPLLKAITLFLSTPVGRFITGLSMIVLLLEDLGVYAKGGKSYFKDFWKQIFGGQNQAMERFRAAGRTIERFFKFISRLLGGKGTSKEAKFLMMIVGAITLLIAAIGWIPVAIAAAIALLAAYWEDIEKFFADLGKRFDEYFGGEFQKLWSDAWEDVKVIASNVLKWIGSKWQEFKDYVSGILDEVKAFFVGIWNDIVSAFESAKESVLGLWEDLKSMFLRGANAIGSALSNAANTAKTAWSDFIGWLEKKWKWITDHLPDFLKAAESMPKAEGAAKMASKGSGGGGNTTTVNDYSEKKMNVTLTNGVSAGRFVEQNGFAAQTNRGLVIP